MYKRSGIKKLGKKKSHREAMINNQLRSLFTSGKVETTSPKAKVLKGAAESLVAKVKGAKDEQILRKDLRRIVGNDQVAELVKEYAAGKGRVTISKIRFRDGDNALISKVALMDLKKKAAKKATTAKKAVKKEDKKVEKKEMNIAKKAIRGVKERTVARGDQSRAKSRSGL